LPKPFLPFVFAVLGTSCLASAKDPIQLAVDLTDAPRKILHAHLVMPVEPGPLTVECPKWIPGEHAPGGPIDNIAGLIFKANGETLRWRRDDVNMFAFHLAVPPGASQLHADVDFLATAAASGFSAGASTGPNLAIVSWNEVLLYPSGRPPSELQVTPSLKLPEGWKFGTALVSADHPSSLVTFHTVSVNTLVDSPVLAGRFFKEIPLAPDITPSHYLDVTADGAEDLEIPSDQLTAYSNLVRETGALYRSRHYRSYHFLLTLSDNVAHFGLEHHESSDDRVEARAFLDEDLALLDGDLLPHEFTHSWNGKYRRPARLTTTDYDQPMRGELLWVYEGLTQYLGEVLSVRSGIWTVDQYRAHLAASAAEMDHRPGRTWRNLEDTAISAQILYSTSQQWDNWRRSVDYYTEGALVWLDVDVTIRNLSHNKKSLDDFCAAFLGARGNTPPEVFPYSFADVVAALNSVQAFDWAAFLNERITSNSPHAPLNGITGGGYRIEYGNESNEFIRSEEGRDRGVNAWYSLGLRTSENNIEDVLVDSPAYRAGLGPDMKIVAVNGRQATDELLKQAIRDAKGNGPAVELIVQNAGFFNVCKLDYHEGEKYPRLVSQGKDPTLLDVILKSLTKR
jgi:predicted metalloprotease with PDZ domain